MKKLFAIALILSMGLVFNFSSCGGKKLGGQVEGDKFTTENWVDENTYRIAASGAPKATLKNKIQRRESAKRAATMNAKYQVLEKFKGSKVEGAAGTSDFENTGMAIAEEVEGFINGGSVISATYDEDDNCEVIYEVKAKGLKKKVTVADWK